MPYLAPPPEPAPVVIVRDIGGSFSEYSRQTAIYRAQKREVKLLECRSECTLAISLPRACVYKSSVLRFAKAYDADTRKVDFAASDAMFRSYPASVRTRLGYLTRKYKSLTGEELIALGIRDCSAPADRPASEAGVSQSALPAYVPPGQGPVARFLARVGASLTNNVSTDLPRRVAAKVTGAVIGLLPERLGGRSPRETESQAAGPALASVTRASLPPVPAADPGFSASGRSAPLPPSRPALLARASRSQLPRVITGAYPVIPPGFRAYAPLR